jgi:hypothetical protein
MAHCSIGSCFTNFSTCVSSPYTAHCTYGRPYNLSSLSVGLLYIAPFVGGVLGSSIAGKLSDIVCRFMARRNDGVFEPEFRLVMVIPVALATVFGISSYFRTNDKGLWGFGWSTQVKDPWIAPTIFFGVIGIAIPPFFNLL